MRILGIDPGYGITGFGVIDAERGNSTLVSCGAITTPAGADFSARLYNCSRTSFSACGMGRPR